MSVYAEERDVQPAGETGFAVPLPLPLLVELVVVDPVVAGALEADALWVRLATSAAGRQSLPQPASIEDSTAAGSSVMLAMVMAVEKTVASAS